MTTPQGAKTPSAFDARADNAAQALRGDLRARGAQVPESAPVAVGPDGKPPAPPPPEGSYARMAHEAARQRAEIGDQPPAGTPEQAIDGSVAPPLEPPGTPPQEQPDTSPRAERRIQELVAQLKAQQEENEALKRAGQQAGETTQQLQQRLQALEQQHREVLQANLDQLDPETRAAIQFDSQLNHRLAELENRLMSRVQPQLQQLETREQRREMSTLSDTYPAFDMVVHGPLIDMFRGKNPNCTIEQAWRAIAEPNELVTRNTARAASVPPVLPPGNGSPGNVRYAVKPEQQSDPAAEIREETERMAKLRASSDPMEQKQGLAAVDDLLRRKLGGS